MKRGKAAIAFLGDPDYDVMMARARDAGPPCFAGYAQAEYKNGAWTGSLGLRSVIVQATDKKAAERAALAVFRDEWRRSRGRGDRLVKIHAHLSEV